MCFFRKSESGSGRVLTSTWSRRLDICWRMVSYFPAWIDSPMQQQRQPSWIWFDKTANRKKQKQKKSYCYLIGKLYWFALTAKSTSCVPIDQFGRKARTKKKSDQELFVCFCVYRNVQEFNETVELPAETSDQLHQLTNDGVSSC